MRKLLIAAAMLTAFTGLANAQAGAQTSSKPEEKQTTPIEISKQSGTASGARGDTGTRGSDSDSSITGRTRSPDIAYGKPVAKKAKAVRKHPTTKHRKATVAAH